MLTIDIFGNKTSQKLLKVSLFLQDPFCKTLTIIKDKFLITYSVATYSCVKRINKLSFLACYY